MSDSKKIFVPKKVVVGVNNNGAGFLTMKDADGKWRNVSVFEKLCGFKPHVQRDARKEISKVLTQKVQEIDNEPTSGFTLVNVFYNPYPYTTLFKDRYCAVLHDPRGWDIAVSCNKLQKFLELNGMNIKDGVLENIKLMYCWYENKFEPFDVIIANDKAKRAQAATDKKISAKDSVEYIKPSKFVVGNIYSSSTSDCKKKFMYLGEHAVYSVRCQLDAYRKKSYKDISKSLEDRTDLTSVSKHIFYCIDYSCDDFYSSSFSSETMRKIGCAPYFIPSSVSKIFDVEENGAECSYIAKCTMHNSSKKPTLENIIEDMDTSLTFNKIDFSAEKFTEEIDCKMFAGFFKHSDYASDEQKLRNLMISPFYAYTSNVAMCTEHLGNIFGLSSAVKFSISTDYFEKKIDIVSARANSERNYYGCVKRSIYKTYRYGIASDTETDEDKLKEIHAELKPYVDGIRLENGRAAQVWQAFAMSE